MKIDFRDDVADADVDVDDDSEVGGGGGGGAEDVDREPILK